MKKYPDYKDSLLRPYVVLNALEKCDDGDFILYSDLNSDTYLFSEMSIFAMIAWLSGDASRLAVAHVGSPNSQFTKRDCFHYMDCDSERYWSYCHFLSSSFAFIVTSKTRRFIEEWFRFCLDFRILAADPNVSGLANLPNFSEHKFDSSIFTNLIVKHDLITPVLRIGFHIKSDSLDCVLNYFEEQNVSSYIDNFEYCISLGKLWTASSGSSWSPAKGQMINIEEDVEFFFHTSFEESPWWLIDLGNDYQVTTIIIFNRITCPFHRRAAELKVYASSDNDSFYPLFDATVATWNPSKPLILQPSRSHIRFIKIALDGMGILHLREVKVFGRA